MAFDNFYECFEGCIGPGLMDIIGDVDRLTLGTANGTVLEILTVVYHAEIRK